MHPSVALALALAALLAPSGAGLLVLLPALRLGAGAPALAGLVLLALAVPVGALRREAAAGHAASVAASAEAGANAEAGADDDAVAAPRHGLRLEGRWRAPPGVPPFIDTDDGPLAVEVGPDVDRPPAGTPVVALARLDAEGGARVVALQPTGPPRGARIDRWAAAAGERARRLLSADNEGLVAALVLGDRSDLLFPVTADCVATGVIHLLSLSGSHVALLVVMLERCGAGGLRRLAAPLLLFVALAGGQAPLVRSVLCWAAHQAARLSASPAPPLHRLAAVFLLMEAWTPGLHGELSVQLSFLSLAGLLCAVRLVRGPLALVAAGAGAFLATAPLCAETFGSVQPWGVVVTPLTVPPVGLILGVGLIALVPVSTFSALDALSQPLLEGAGTALRELLAMLARRLPAPLSPPPLPAPGWAVSLLVVAALAALSHGPWRLPARGRIADALT